MKIAVLILAAGGGSRFGSNKQLALINGRPMLQHCINTANSLCPNSVYTVLGSQAEQLSKKISNTKLIFNEQWQEGLGSSIAAGATHLQNRCDAILILLADQPAVNRDYLERLIRLFEGSELACSRYSAHLGVPAIFGPSHFSALKNMEGDEGAKMLLQSVTPRPKSLALGASALDIDTPEDLDIFLDQIKNE